MHLAGIGRRAMASRLRIARTATVEALVQVLENFLVGRKTRDLLGLLKEIEKATTWKTAPRTSLLAGFSDLTLALLEKALPSINW